MASMAMKPYVIRKTIELTSIWRPTHHSSFNDSREMAYLKLVYGTCVGPPCTCIWYLGIYAVLAGNSAQKDTFIWKCRSKLIGNHLINPIVT